MTRRWSVGLLVGVVAAGCAADEFIESDDWIDDEEGAVSEIAISGRWLAPSSTLAAGDRQTVGYDEAGAWNGGRNCGGGLLAGSRQLGDHLRARFRGVSRYEGYACRQNTASAGQLSVHGTGRAIDVFIPLSRGSADNTYGDAIANWLIENAQSIGVQYIVWDRSSWSASRPRGAKLRGYTGPHPHHDHLHIELTVAAAARRTPWFTSGGSAVTPTPSTPTPSTPMVVGVNLRVTAGSLNLRSGPGTGYRIVDVMSCGESARVVASPVNGWWNINYQGTSGWASSSYLQTDATFNPAVCR